MEGPYPRGDTHRTRYDRRGTRGRQSSGDRQNIECLYTTLKNRLNEEGKRRDKVIQVPFIVEDRTYSSLEYVT